MGVYLRPILSRLEVTNCGLKTSNCSAPGTDQAINGIARQKDKSPISESETGARLFHNGQGKPSLPFWFQVHHGREGILIPNGRQQAKSNK
jgi:hypothetical protein